MDIHDICMIKSTAHMLLDTTSTVVNHITIKELEN